LRDDIAQLRDLLFTKDSAKVPQEDQDYRLVSPQITQANRASQWIEQGKGGERVNLFHGMLQGK
jgi:hypothetical protein